MATILGEANLSTDITAEATDTIVATRDTTRTTTTDWRSPVSISNRDAGCGTEISLPHISRKYNGSNYTAYDYMHCNFDFLDVDKNATISSMEIEITATPKVLGYSAVNPSGYPNSYGSHGGSIELYWNSWTAGGSSFAVEIPFANNVNEQTLTFTVDGYGAQNPSDTTYGPYDTSNFGPFPVIIMKLNGVVTNLHGHTHGTYGSSMGDDVGDNGAGRYGGGWGWGGNYAHGLYMTISNIRARYNYVGRTHLITGLQSPVSSDYNFTNLIPSDADYQGVSVLASASDGFVYPYKCLTFKNSADNNLLSTASPTAPESVDHQSPHIWSTQFPAPQNICGTGGPPHYGTGTIASTKFYSNGVVWADNQDNGLINEVVPTVSLFRDSTFDLEYYKSQYPSETVDPASSQATLTLKQVNVAYQQEFTGKAELSTSFTTTFQGNLIHGIVDSELSDIAPAFTMTTLGGFLLKDPQPEVDVSFTVAPNPATTGLIKGYLSSTTQSLSTNISIANILAENTLTTGSTQSFSITTAPVGTVLIDTLVASPINPIGNFSVSLDVSNTGLLIQVTSLKPADPVAAVAIADLVESSEEGYQIIRSPAPERLLVRQPRTHIFLTDTHNRTINGETFTRTITAEHNRTISEEAFTRITTSEGLL